MSFMLQYRDRQRKGKRRARCSVEDFNYEEEDTVNVKKGKTKQVYGVSNNKWYAHSNSKEAIEALKLAGKVEAFEDREKIFDESRAGLMKLIRYSAKSFQNFTFFFTEIVLEVWSQESVRIF